MKGTSPRVRRDKIRKRLGQHYLIDESVVNFMVEKAAIAPHESVLEIGTGKGVLTERLCEFSKNVEAFEVDIDNFNETMALGLEGLRLHLGDAFSEPRRFDILVSSLPYSESSTLIDWLSKLSYDRAVVMLQKDFVEKLNARPGDERYRAVSAISQISSNVKPVLRVDRSSFSPVPRVTSVVAVIKPKRVLTAAQIGLIKLIFSQKRRKLSAAFGRLGLEVPDPEPKEMSERVERLSPEKIASLLAGVRSSL